MTRKTWRTVWISDVHLGTRGCKAELLHAFLKSHYCEQLYLVGDIIDGWRIATAKFYWPSAHNQVVRQILRKPRKMTPKLPISRVIMTNFCVSTLPNTIL